MADDFIELACESLDRASSPSRTFHKKRREKRERASAPSQSQSQSQRLPPPPISPLERSSHPDSDTSSIEEIPRSPEWKRQYGGSAPNMYSPSAGFDTGIGSAVPAYGVYGSEKREGSRRTSRRHKNREREREREKEFLSNEEEDEIAAYRSRRNTAPRPQFRSRSSHQGNHTSQSYRNEKGGYEDSKKWDSEEDYHTLRKSHDSHTTSTKHHRASRSTSHTTHPSSRPSSTPNSTSKDNATGGIISTTPAALGLTALGGLAGALLGARAGSKKANERKSGSEGGRRRREKNDGNQPLLFGLLGAAVGSLGAHVVERYVEEGKEEGMVRDTWGDEVGGRRRKYKGKMGM